MKPDLLANNHTNGINTGFNEHTALKLVRMLIKLKTGEMIHLSPNCLNLEFFLGKILSVFCVLNPDENGRIVNNHAVMV